MNDPISSARRAIARAWRFFSHDVWDARRGDSSGGRAFWYRAARIFYCSVRGLFFEDTLPVRAAALTYFSVLSLVSLLAFAFALLKGFGA